MNFIVTLRQKNNEAMTEKYHELDPMSDVISDDYRMLQMLGRFGITLGFGNQTVGETCKAAGVDVTTFLTVVNYVKDAAHAHINEMVEQIDLPCLMRYLKNSHTYFVDFRLPNIRRKLLEAIDCSSSNQIAMLILKFYDTVVRQHEDNHASLEKSIAELKNIIIKYYPNDNAAQLMGEVLMDIFMTEEDLLTHCHMEDTLFAECVRRLEFKVRQAGGAESDDEGDDEPLVSALLFLRNGLTVRLGNKSVGLILRRIAVIRHGWIVVPRSEVLTHRLVVIVIRGSRRAQLRLGMPDGRLRSGNILGIDRFIAVAHLGCSGSRRGVFPSAARTARVRVVHNFSAFSAEHTLISVRSMSYDNYITDRVICKQ